MKKHLNPLEKEFLIRQYFNNPDVSLKSAHNFLLAKILFNSFTKIRCVFPEHPEEKTPCFGRGNLTKWAEYSGDSAISIFWPCGLNSFITRLCSFRRMVRPYPHGRSIPNGRRQNRVRTTNIVKWLVVSQLQIMFIFGNFASMSLCFQILEIWKGICQEKCQKIR